MIDRIRVRNFQSLKKIDLELGSITSIVGESDSGKSALFRAVKAVVSNRAGSDFITFGEKRTAVALDNVAWIQSSKDNSYQIGKRKWEKCGRGVPDDVSAELNMGEFEFGKDVKLFLNFSGQLDDAFIVQGNPADNAKVIGSISNIHIIYNALREAEKDTKAIKRKITTVQEQVDQFGEQLEQDEPEFERLELLYAKMQDISERAKNVDSKMTDIASLKVRIIDLPDEVKLRKRIQKLACIDFDNIYSKITDVEQAKDMAGQYMEVEAEIKAAQMDQTAFDGVSTKKGYKLLENIKVLSESTSGLRDVTERIGNIETQIIDIKMEIERLEDQRQEIDACELCGSPQSAWRL